MVRGIAEHTLDNGLKVICLPTRGAPIAAVQVWYRTGSVYERDGIRGISHFLEHMMFRGSAAYGPEEHARRINEVGGRSNAFTAEDITAFLNAVPSDHLRMVLEMESDRMASLTLDPAILETERKVLIEEYHGYMNNPVTRAFLEFRSEFFGSHPYALAPLGAIEDLERISVEDCRSYFRRHYSPSNAALIVVGDIHSPERVFGMARECFGSREAIAAGNGGQAPAFNLPASVPKRMLRRVDFDVPLLVAGFPAPPARGQDVLALEMLQLILAQGESSRIYRNLVRDRSIAIMAGGMNHFLKHAGMSLFFAAFSPDVSARRIERALTEQITMVCDKGVTYEEIDKVRNTTLAHRVFEMYSCEHLCQRIGFSETVEGDYRLWVRRLADIEAITPSQLQEAARRWWSEANSRVLHLKPKRVSLALRLLGIARRFLPQ